MLELYHHNTSVCAAKVRLVLEEKGLKWEGRYVDIIAGEQFKPEFLEINPKALVPVLVQDGAIIRESTVINEYLDQVFPDPPLRPADPVAQARMRLWTKMVDEGLHLACGTVTFVNLHRYTILKMPPKELEQFLSETRDPLWRERKRTWVLQGVEAPDVRDAIKLFDKTFADMEAALAEQRWLAGESYSLADVALTPYVNRINMLDLKGMFAGRRRLADWFERIKARANFKSAIMNWIPDSVALAMRTNGSINWPRFEQLLRAA